MRFSDKPVSDKPGVTVNCVLAQAVAKSGLGKANESPDKNGFSGEIFITLC